MPAAFRFAVKLPKVISHQRRLVDCADSLDHFLNAAGVLEEKLAVLLLQLPPSFAFDARLVGGFLDLLSPKTSARIVCEPRHASWFDAGAYSSGE